MITLKTIALFLGSIIAWVCGLFVIPLWVGVLTESDKCITFFDFFMCWFLGFVLDTVALSIIMVLTVALTELWDWASDTVRGAK